MAKAVAAHQEHAGLYFFLGSHGERVGRHYSIDPRLGGMTAFHDHAFHQIAFGEDSHENTLSKHRHSTDVACDHRLRDLEHKLVGVGAIGVLVFDQIANSHGPPLA